MEQNKSVKTPTWLSRSIDRSAAIYRAEPRRAALAITTFVVALALIATGTVGLLSDDTSSQRNGQTGAQLATGTGAGPRSPVSGEQTPTTAPDETSTTTNPSDVTSTSSAPQATSAPGAPAPGVAPQPPATQPNWVTTSGSGLRLSISATKPVVNTGEPVTFNATVDDSSGGLTALIWDFGDGNGTTTDVQECSDAANRPTVESGRTSFTASTQHTFRSPGDFSVSVLARTGARCGSRAASDAVTARGSVRVVGETVTNGSAQPTANVTIRSGGMSNDPLLGLSIRASDSDGYISSIIVNWDDGAAPTVISYPLTSCVTQLPALPSSSRLEIPERNYTEADSYNITVTVTSVGCDGSQAQQAISVLNGVNVGGVASQGSGGESSTSPEPDLFSET